jgi:hypothetical protein
VNALALWKATELRVAGRAARMMDVRRNEDMIALVVYLIAWFCDGDAVRMDLFEILSIANRVWLRGKEVIVIMKRRSMTIDSIPSSKSNR